MAKNFCVDAGNQHLDLCFEKKESAFEYARAVSRMEGKSVRVVRLGGVGKRRRRRRRR